MEGRKILTGNHLGKGQDSSKLFQPGVIGQVLNVKNRLVRSATLEGMATEEGRITDKLIELYNRLARGGVGLIITGAASVQKSGRAVHSQIGVHNDDLIPGMKMLADSVHKLDNECKIAMQVHHPGRQVPGRSGSIPIAPTDAKDKFYGTVPRMMSEDEIQQLVEDFGEGARRVFEAGFDAVQLHGAHGYILSEFLSPHVNTRKDKYGGSLENRMRILFDIYHQIVKNVGRKFPVLIKLNGDDLVPEGLHIDEAMTIAKRLEEVGYAAIESSAGTWEAIPRIKPFSLLPEARLQILRREQEAYNLPYAKELKTVLRRAPVILVGGLRSLDVAEEILSNGWADFCAMCRPFIRDPELPNKWMNGSTSKSNCISCNKCFDRVLKGEGIECVQTRLKADSNV
jgi:2,4-dienoyl-CoA reductase-like NADH-dependent reductase (Old Yellow Enzyme family)